MCKSHVLLWSVKSIYRVSSLVRLYVPGEQGFQRHSHVALANNPIHLPTLSDLTWSNALIVLSHVVVVQKIVWQIVRQIVWQIVRIVQSSSRNKVNFSSSNFATDLFLPLMWVSTARMSILFHDRLVHSNAMIAVLPFCSPACFQCSALPCIHILA